MKRSFVYGILWGYLLVTVLPLVWVLSTSFKSSRDVFLEPFKPPQWGNWQWVNYSGAWKLGHFGDYALNSLIVTAGTTILTVSLGAMAAYALARFTFKGRDSLMLYLLGGLTLPLQLVVIPLFFELKKLGLLNSLPGLILVYVATGLPFAVFVLASFFRSLPDELYEAALLDGCTEWQAFWKVMLPLAQPGLATVAIFTALSIYNEYFLAFMFLSGEGSENIRTLPLGLANLTIVSQYRTDYGQLFAGLIIVATPTLIGYLVMQKHIAKGVTGGAVKG